MHGTRVKLYKTPELVPTALRDTRFSVRKMFTTHLRPSESRNDLIEWSSSELSAASFDRSGWISFKDGPGSPTSNVLGTPQRWKQVVQADAIALDLITGPGSEPSPASGSFGLLV